jgi:hypothetical protein
MPRLSCALIPALLACTTAQPLPETRLSGTQVTARMMQVGGLQGFLARPDSASDQTADLLLIEAHRQESASSTVGHAEAGRISLAITPATSLSAARDYLTGLAGINEVEVHCHRTQCDPSR